MSCLFIAACEKYETQLIGGHIEVDGESLGNAKVAYVHDDMSCDDISAAAPYQYYTNSSGWFARNREIDKSRTKNYFKQEKLCIDRGNGWEIAWDKQFDFYPGQIQFACFGSKAHADWKCVLQCAYCDHEKTTKEIAEILNK